jgi:hypothetical protein|tara:strand:+ start:2974 stop:3414 length:441 start_codon:yes stop_codon:yes gene_type:complete
VIAAIVLSLVWSIALINQPSNTMPSRTNVKVGDAVVIADIADTVLSRTKGLSNVAILPDASGMLFVFKDKDIRSFWMKDMLISLDVLWIADGVVVGMQENIPYKSDDESVVRFKSEAPADMVLEVNAGWIAKNGIKIGDLIVVDSN